MIDPTTKLGDLVSARPELARELERRGLDYCCGGDQTLAGACAAQRIDVVATLAELTAAVSDDGPAAWALMGVAQLTDHIETSHHRYLRDELPRLSSLIGTIVRVHGDRHPELHALRRDFAVQRDDLEPHLDDEERVVFPLIRRLTVAGSASPEDAARLDGAIAVMRSEHDHVGELLGLLRQVTYGYQPPADGCATYMTCYAGLAELEADTHLHVHKENNLLFPAVVRLQARLRGAVA